MVAAGRPNRIRPQARWRFRSIHHPAGRDGPAQADELQGQRRTSGVVARWGENYVLQHADGLQGRGAIHVRAATIWRPVRDAERWNADRAADRQPVGRRRPELAGAEELTPGAREIPTTSRPAPCYARRLRVEVRICARRPPSEAQRPDL